ncbi:MAG TPA: 2Fe-2S iron-sulfur cluster-binding protein, partial [Candidatus Heimdallarchaeota archaeon]|nr:2Fe-2S iron-sulfur cluster-binding protein [Candidatus Heimdallarchaeota archaeon]
MESQLGQPMSRVTFLPSEESIEVESGTTLLDAAKQAGVFVASICGGDGICGKCRLVVQSGEVDASPTTLLSRQEIQAGYVLACQTKV